ncbi:polysaccharide biosynthesis tyrosine autokinase [Burkholderia sp. TSV86]|uniref:polysaccharide biosynthesis tyrosine autokinase n=1 Tax=Burkholderia sp. TSV86 TaxID=1385594 RepID=UPI00075B1836|nr:polysaccharide biosynthesis tyrosine autokinase [Burkholderia sp. TSV86]KVE36257.1 exopolysaccharide biosynthesis protein [Burkholderia sp. TSV86]
MVNTQAPHPYAGLAVKTDEEDVVLGHLLQVIIDDIWLLLGIALVVVAFASFYCYVAKPMYSADAHVRVESGDSTSQALTQTQTGAVINSGPPTPQTDAEIEIIKSRGVVAPVVEQFKLNVSVMPKTFPILGAIAARLAAPGHPAEPWLDMPSYGWGGEEAVIDSIMVAPAFEGRKLTLTAGTADDFTLTDPDGRLLLRGKLGKIERGAEVTMKVTKLIARPGTQFVVVRLNDLDAITGFQSGIQVSEQGKQTGVIQISLEGNDPEQTAQIANALAQSYLHQHVTSKQAEATKMLEFLKSEEPRLKADLERTEAQLTEYQRTSGSINASDEARVYLEGSVLYEQQIAAQRLQLASLAQRYTDEHPLVVAARRQLGQLEAERSRYERKFRGLPLTEAKAVALQRNAKVAEDIYVLLLNRVQELSVQKAGMGGNIRLVDAALRPGQPIKPKKALILSAAMLLGLIVGTGAVFLRRNLLRGIEDPDRIERMFNLPLYGLVPHSDEQARLDASARNAAGRAPQPILACVKPKDMSVESLRSLRTAMQFVITETKNRVVLLTGPMPRIGKSFLAVNLAALVAHSGKRVLLIDADMRRGMLERHFDAEPASGLSELLSGQAALEEAIRETTVPGLSFISSGACPPNPSELLMSPRLSQYLDGIAKRYDLVLVDSPPILTVTDAAILGELAGATFLVLRSGMHTEAEISDAIKRLRTAGVYLQGGIFNGVPPHTRGYGRGCAAMHEYLGA